MAKLEAKTRFSKFHPHLQVSPAQPQPPNSRTDALSSFYIYTFFKVDMLYFYFYSVQEIFFFFFGRAACRILVPQPGIKPEPARSGRAEW